MILGFFLVSFRGTCSPSCFLRYVAFTAALCVSTFVIARDNEAAPRSKEQVADLYFTSWQYVATGDFGWVDTGGKNLPLWGDEGDESATFRPGAARGIRLVTQQPTRIKLDDRLGLDPAGMPGAMTILEDQGRYQCWYTIHPNSNEGQASPLRGHNHYLCYAESDDGFTWNKPKLGLIDYEGSRDNNLVFAPTMGSPVRGMFGQGVFRDSIGASEERFKMVYMAHFTSEEVTAYRQKYPDDILRAAVHSEGSAWGIAGAVSSDGIRWKPLAEPMLIDHPDSFNMACYDPLRDEYVLYFRTWVQDPRSVEGFQGRRAVARAFSKDFRHWNGKRTLLNTGADMPPAHVWYGPGRTSLPRCLDQQVMFAFRWKLEDDTFETRLYSTPDGESWSEVPGGPLLSPGQTGTWEGGYCMPCGDLVELPGDRWGLPYTGSPIPHKYPRVAPEKRERHRGVAAARGYATWPRGRLVALECDDSGQFSTIAIKPAGDHMFLNASIAADGMIKVSVRTPSGAVAERRIADCDPLQDRDGYAIPVTWHGEGSLLVKDQPVVLEFQLRKAALFGITFR